MSAQGHGAIGGDAVVRLARGVRMRRDEARGQTVLLAPERALALDEIAVAIVEALDGTRSLDRIVDDLARAYAAPREQVAQDVTSFVQALAERRMLEIEP